VIGVYPVRAGAVIDRQPLPTSTTSLCNRSPSYPCDRCKEFIPCAPGWYPFVAGPTVVTCSLLPADRR
jgi:hypothetical protein